MQGTDTLLIRNAAAIVTMDDESRVLRGADILVQDGTIAAVGAVPPEQAARAARVVDARQRVVLPGLVNAHSHSPLAYAKGSYDLVNHRAALWMFQAFTANATPDEIRCAALLNCLEMLRTGTTAVIDHFPEQGFTLEQVDAVAAAYNESGMRAIIALRIFDEPYADIYPPAGAFPPELDAELRAAAVLEPRPAPDLLALVEAAIHRHHDPAGMVQVAPAPSNPMRCTDALLAGCQQLAERHDAIVHCHLLETRVQAEIAHRRYGRSQIRHLDRLGVLTDRLSCAHVIWADDDDIPLLAERGTIPVHNPESNVRGGSGVAPIARMIRAGVTVAIGADGSPSGGNQAMQHSLRLATIVARPQDREVAHWVTTADALRMATRGGAAAMRQRIGCIAPGMAADLALYDLRSPWWTPLNDPVHQFVYSETGASVREVFVAGRQVVAEGRVTAFDEQAVLEEAQGRFDALLRRNHRLLDLSRRLAAATLR
ncbi:amidohydrolase family protein [Falsiroseomonas oryzae]|uniref:amidohydrolase family protein n=1 Tax=Falsiroseomonas oryzae TaxID=2766473 RepID=UPI0022EB5C1E|nr:amidohydrolase family protein [Roseomonas sp. MO-31]